MVNGARVYVLKDKYVENMRGGKTSKELLG
jgi:hypothetical protein